MKGKTHSTEEIIRILRQADGGKTAQSVCREHNISEQTFYRWKKKYGDMELADAKRLKELEKKTQSSRGCWPNRCWKIACLKRSIQKNGKPFAEKAGCCASSAAAAVLGAKGVHLP
jgi:putative transposase